MVGGATSLTGVVSNETNLNEMRPLRQGDLERTFTALPLYAFAMLRLNKAHLKRSPQGTTEGHRGSQGSAQSGSTFLHTEH